MSTTDQQRFRVPTRDEIKAFASEVRRESRVHVPLELDPRSPLYDKHEMRSAVIAIGFVAGVVLIGLTVGFVALFG
ncbi:hypothetical protein ACXR2U_07985 [Jatrophihabitans sp. YIM 134969]